MFMKKYFIPIFIAFMAVIVVLLGVEMFLLSRSGNRVAGSGPETYRISQAPGTLPAITSVTIDPMKVLPGNTQKFTVVMEDPDTVTSVEAVTATDHATTTVTLALDQASSSGSQQVFTGQWVVRDTHEGNYGTAFTAKDASGHQSSLSLDWSDPYCNPWQDAGGGTYLVSTASVGGSACEMSQNSTVQNGNIAVNGVTLTVDPNVNLSFSPGYQLNIGTGGALAMASGASISKTTVANVRPTIAAPVPGITFDGTGAYATLSASGPVTQDFKVQVCFYGGRGTACVTSPWASTAITGSGTWTDTNPSNGTFYITGSWSGWNWPGGADGLSSVSASIVATQALPAGDQALTNLQLGIELAEDNGGSNVGSNYNLPDETSCTKQSFSPIGGGSGPEVYSYTYEQTCGGPSATPDVFRVALTGVVSTRQVSLSSSGIPSSITHGSAVSGATITAVNNGNVPVVATSIGFAATGAGTGTCDTDTDGDGVYDAPSTSDSVWDGVYGDIPPTVTCTITGNVTDNGIYLTHVGSFSESTPIPLVVAGVTKTTSYRGGYSTEIGTGCTAMAPSHQFFALIPVAHAVSIGGCTIRPVLPYSSVSYNQTVGSIAAGSSAVFALPAMTAPVSPGTYTEKWTVSDPNSVSLGAITNSTISQSITVN